MFYELEAAEKLRELGWAVVSPDQPNTPILHRMAKALYENACGPEVLRDMPWDASVREDIREYFYRQARAMHLMMTMDRIKLVENS